NPRKGEECCQLENVCPADNTACNDSTSGDHVSALLEMDQPMPIFVIADTAPILVGINADVRPGSATVDGIIGTQMLQQLVSDIDYPGHRLVARCADGNGCLTYPAYRNPSAFNHPGGMGSGCGHDEFCQQPKTIPPNGGLCPPAP